jgi:hypothetical protein
MVAVRAAHQLAFQADVGMVFEMERLNCLLSEVSWHMICSSLLNKYTSQRIVQVGMAE